MKQNTRHFCEEDDEEKAIYILAGKKKRKGKRQYKSGGGKHTSKWSMIQFRVIILCDKN